jgi:hypothetical protein
MADDGGVLGNLPRSRPGHRSEKRTAAKAAPRTERSAAERPAAKASAGRAKPGAAKRPQGTATSQRRPTEDAPAARSGDAVGDTIRTVAGVASTGARVAGGVAREVLRRLPRP